MTNPFNWTFNEVTSAYALFFKNDHNYHAFRLEVPEAGLEFTDGAYIGKDPEGFLYYNNLQDFEKGTGKKHNYHILQDSIGGKTYAVVEFRHSANATPYAKFYAPDNHRVTSAADMQNYSSTGNWVALEATSTYTTIEKKSNSRTVTVNMPSADKVATWDAGSTNFNPSSFSVTGHIHYKKLSKLKDAKYANYNNDRVVFYENDWTGRDFVAFFIPREDQTPTLGIESTRTTPALTFSNVKWV
ncbi:hypothetical protein C8R43DRAFT_1199900 [Mycena crocata]|nr:hypothetical protein C8R43DRAFT_1199900 [Mycena crocata]